MLDYIFSLNQIFAANIIGVVTGFLLSTIVDNYFFNNRFKASDSKFQKTATTIFWSTIIALIMCFLFLISASIDYWLGFAPTAGDTRFLENESLLNAFCGAFFAGMSNSFINIFNQFFASKSSK